MPSPWIDLLSLHGYISDPRLLRRLTALARTTHRSMAKTNKASITPVRQVVATLRMCLGIGDGVLRSQ